MMRRALPIDLNKIYKLFADIYMKGSGHIPRCSLIC